MMQVFYLYGWIGQLQMPTWKELGSTPFCMPNQFDCNHGQLQYRNWMMLIIQLHEAEVFPLRLCYCLLSTSLCLCSYTPGSAMPSSPQPNDGPSSGSVAREALKFLISPEGSFFRDFLMTEIVQSIDALSRKQVHTFPPPLPRSCCQEWPTF